MFVTHKHTHTLTHMHTYSSHTMGFPCAPKGILGLIIHDVCLRFRGVGGGGQGGGGRHGHVMCVDNNDW